jgi:hypothetical protein
MRLYRSRAGSLSHRTRSLTFEVPDRRLMVLVNLCADRSAASPSSKSAALAAGVPENSSAQMRARRAQTKSSVVSAMSSRIRCASLERPARATAGTRIHPLVRRVTATGTKRPCSELPLAGPMTVTMRPRRNRLTIGALMSGCLRNAESRSSQTIARLL